jgi:hypothetical protein
MMRPCHATGIKFPKQCNAHTNLPRQHVAPQNAVVLGLNFGTKSVMYLNTISIAAESKPQ